MDCRLEAAGGVEHREMEFSRRQRKMSAVGVVSPGICSGHSFREG